ncbi:growth/differentiation factor 8 [Mugil cephalus]|uniref:growth/differentiation factor 8 n=1 Tax=Mugil cephalus TaxID=48193 RepID=UPI001FB74DCF|nr:growth/differentiation factor 8 [Mugil cephalus]
MLRSHTLLRLITCTLLLPTSTSGESRPHVVQGGTPNADRKDIQEALLLEAVKTGILSSLGMDREPRITRKASEQELRRMYQLYIEKRRELRGNSSQSIKNTLQSTTTTVLFTVEAPKVLRRRPRRCSGQHIQWYRAVFHQDPNIRTEPTVARAELKISMRALDKATLDAKQKIKVKVNGMKPSPGWTYTDSVVHTNISSTRDVIVDMSPDVERWMRTGGQPLVVDVGMVVANREASPPIISLELDLTQPKPAQSPRLRRSNKEDECDERGWCCRKSINVSFKDIGWTDWVVAPAEYTMHFCDGTCPHNYKPASMHTQVKSRLHLITKGGTPHPCCVPAAYEPMVLMHYDSGGRLKLTPFNDFIVSKCHCA